MEDPKTVRGKGRDATASLTPSPAEITDVDPPRRARRDSASALDFSRNKSIGRFELIREIARGGMGQVFLGRDTKLGRKVAVKFLLRDDAHFVQRFIVEARATARCAHENIVTIYEVGEHEGLPYMVLEFLEGKTLGGVLAGKPSVRQFVELMVPVARALERAHEHGIVHRDLKPSNIFVTDRGGVKVLDFGVARLVEKHEHELARATAVMEAVSIDDNDFTGSNSLVGTLPYMSPEQWGADEVDALSDIWALGVLFWRGLAGVHPAGTMVPDRLRARVLDLDSPLQSIGKRVPSLPRDLVAIVDKCLAKRKHDRYQSATAVIADLQQFLAPKTTSEICPYRGLSAFGEDDAKFFFGRSSEIRTALSQLDVWPLLAVVGPSGVGKSSFVHAGLVPAIKAAGGNWRVRVLRPGRAPLQRLAALIEGSLDDDSPGQLGQKLREKAAKENTNILVIVDQLEELFTLCDDDEVRRGFLAALLAAADDASAPVRVVLSMRADFLDRLAGHKHFLAELTRGLFFLTAPDQDNLRETLVRPAELAGYAFESPAIVEDMMQAATSRGALPLLSFAATRLWEARDRNAKLLTVAAYNSMGGVGGAFARHADQVAAAVPPQQQPLLRAIMTRLVTPEGTRAVVDHRELLSLSPDTQNIIDMLVRARLIHMQTDPDQGATVEIVHEMLITEWPTLKRWLDDSQAMRGFMAELRQAANQWAARGKPTDLVWRGATAQEALGHVSRHVLDLAANEKDFIAAVRSGVTRARRRKVLGVAAVATVLGIIFAGGSVALLRIKQAESVAQDRAHELQGKVEALEAEKHARESAEAQTLAEETKRKEAEQDLQANKELSKEQLEAANAELQRQVKEAQAAKEKAQANEAIARKATEEAKAAKKAVDDLLAEKAAELARLKKATEGIATSLEKKK